MRKVKREKKLKRSKRNVFTKEEEETLRRTMTFKKGQKWSVRENVCVCVCVKVREIKRVCVWVQNCV